MKYHGVECLKNTNNVIIDICQETREDINL